LPVKALQCFSVGSSLNVLKKVPLLGKREIELATAVQRGGNCFNAVLNMPLALFFLSGSATRGRIFSCVRPFYELAASDLDRSMHRSLWV
jgi:hypothetical protein